MNDKLRGTGRTTRLIEEARRLVNEGKQVIIYCANHKQIQYIREMIGWENYKIRFEVLDGLQLDRYISYGFDTRFLKMGNIEREVLIDHYAIEHNFHSLLAELHRFDN